MKRDRAAIARRIVFSLVLGLTLHLRMIPAAADGDVSAVSSSPAPGGFLTAAPAEVRVTLSDRLRPDGSYVAVMAPGGIEVNDGPTQIATDGVTLVAPLRAGLPDGLYNVTWGAASASGTKRGEGSFDFGVRAGAPPPTLRADRASASAGSALGLTGAGFKQNGSVAVSAGIDDELVGAGAAGADGTVALTMQLPADLPNGPQRVTVADGDGASATVHVQIVNSAAPPIRVRVDASSAPTSVTFQVTVVNRSGTDLRVDAVRLPLPAGTGLLQASPGGYRSPAHEAAWDNLTVRSDDTLGPLSVTLDTRSLADGTPVSAAAWVHYLLPLPPAGPTATPTPTAIPPTAIPTQAPTATLLPITGGQSPSPAQWLNPAPPTPIPPQPTATAMPTATPITPQRAGQGAVTSDPATVRVGGLN